MWYSDNYSSVAVGFFRFPEDILRKLTLQFGRNFYILWDFRFEPSNPPPETPVDNQNIKFSLSLQQIGKLLLFLHFQKNIVCMQCDLK